MNKELWTKVGSWALILIAGASAVMDAINKTNQEKQFKKALDDIEVLKTKVKDS